MAEDDDAVIVHLNVGGARFTTHIGTLRTYRESVLCNMFTPPIAAPRDPRDGSYFIDRNPTVFPYILDYLRTGTLVVPRDPLQYSMLRREVGFFGFPIAGQLPLVQPTLWESAPARYRHARIQVEDMDKKVEWEEGPLPPDINARTVIEIVQFFSGKGYKIASEFVSRGSKGLVSIWMKKKDVYPGVDVALELRDRPTGTATTAGKP